MSALKLNLRDHFLQPDCESRCYICDEPNCEVIVMDHPHHVRCFQRIANGSVVSSKIRPAGNWGKIQMHALDRYSD